jgi:hypothetical protein
MTFILFWLVIGVVLSGGLLLFLHPNPPSSRFNSLGYCLIIAALIYPGFALLATSPTWIVVESLGVVIYGLFFWLFKRRGIVFLACGWLLHPVWDSALHLFGGGGEIAPQWYALLCISFDITVGTYVFYQYWLNHMCSNKLNSDY